jgi:hypothetical protein
MSRQDVAAVQEIRQNIARELAAEQGRRPAENPPTVTLP